MLAWQTDQWTPARIPGLIAWFSAQRSYVTIDTSPDVLTWRSRHTDGQILTTTGVAAPDWLPNGWGQGIPAIGMSVAVGNALSTTTGGLVTPFTGTDLPFSIMCTVRPQSALDQVIVGWAGPSDLSVSSLAIHSGIPRYSRTDAASNLATLDGSAEIGTVVNRRMAVLFTGTSGEVYVDRTVVAAGACNVGAMTPDIFKIGSGPLPADGFTGLVADVAVFSRECTVAEYFAYYNWSMRTLG